MLLDYRTRNGLKVSMMRMPMILGPGFYHEKSVLEMMRRVRDGSPLPLPGGPEIPFIAVAASDAAQAFLAASEQEQADGEAFNIAAARPEPTREFFKQFIRAVGSRSRIVPVPRWIMSPLISLAVKLNMPLPLVHTPAELLPFALTGGDYDIAKARRILGFAPEKECLTAMVETYQWVLDHKVISGQ
jgi:nucleoside-diphosphate-sugar epimerase